MACLGVPCTVISALPVHIRETLETEGLFSLVGTSAVGSANASPVLYRAMLGRARTESSFFASENKQKQRPPPVISVLRSSVRSLKNILIIQIENDLYLQTVMTITLVMVFVMT